MKDDRIRNTYDITGVVQGVGFRPTVFRLATESHLAGSVQNRAGTVRLILEGPACTIESFIRDLPSQLPPNAVLDSIVLLETMPVSGKDAFHDFQVIESEEGEPVRVVIPADLAVCPDCMGDVLEPGNRRYGYAFTTCTICGPRYTVVNSMPYDRERTTMSAFQMCPECRKEYENPDDRRFHAETIACPRCGPKLTLEDSHGNAVAGDPIRQARREIANGKIVAVRGIGGFLLAADAFNRETIQRLRERKNRPSKPFAVMAADLDTVRQFCDIPPEAEILLTAPEAPIVILGVNPDEADLPLDLLSPDTMTLGVMLPTSPLHMLLATPLEEDPVPQFPLLIMTSGNRRSEPTCTKNEEARERLNGIADFLLFHDREINLRNDDSLVAIQRDLPQVWRRARGFAPNPVFIQTPLSRCVLAMGAEIKNTIGVGFDDTVFISPHVGDLETPEAIDGLEKVAESLPVFLNHRPEAVAVDLHPDMHSTVLGRRIAAKFAVPVVPVQHHHAHAAACLAEHGYDSGLALVFDGTGLGTDGSIWGAELLDVSPSGFKRLATFAGVPLPGGDAAVRRPVRQLVARWIAAGVNISREWQTKLGIKDDELAAWKKQSEELINTPVTHAAGRVFDSFSALLGFAPPVITYEGQPAIRLEAAARRYGDASIPGFALSHTEQDGMLVVDWSQAFAMFADAASLGDRENELAMCVHCTVADAAAAMVQYAFDRQPAERIAMTGGVFMNRILTEILIPRLRKFRVELLIHHQVPPNDGCISLGQAVVAGRGEGVLLNTEH